MQSEGRDYQPERLLQPEDVASIVVHALTLPRTAEITEVYVRSMLKP
jgi:NADP-dependent 3-hydroxy acid dehydrogenase YdfG